MRRPVAFFFAVCLVAVPAIAVVAGDEIGGDGSGARFSVVYLDQLSRGERGAIRAGMTRSGTTALQDEIASDFALHRKFQVRGIRLKNIVGRRAAMNGATIYYIR